ncbi:hypothetical protein ACJMK2_036042 [Sinanodonta woodiana]|uniref:Integral membrane protein GPR137B-like n=1 Tax=Sinanodonta woodiana TaxID=1069815 RepID=A0ABD3WFY1_SINWO
MKLTGEEVYFSLNELSTDDNENEIQDIPKTITQSRDQVVRVRDIVESVTFSPEKIKPALTPKAELGLTATFITIYGILFLMIYVQLWMIWCYRHKRLSYQTVFLYLCLVWTGLRASLFSFYFYDCQQVNTLEIVLYWLLFCLPVCLQFIILCLLVQFFSEVVFKARAKYEPSRFKKPVRVAIVLAVLIFLATNIACAVLVKSHERTEHSVPFYLLYIRVAINDSLFIIMAIVLSVCIFKMAKMSSASVVLEAKGTTVCQAIVVCVLIILLYTSRAVYNFVAICPISREKNVPSFGYNWINVSDQAEMVTLDKGYAFLSFGIVLFVWEIVPTFIVIIFFRVRKPASGMALADLSTHSQGTKAYFFDNPRRYDSDEDLSHSDHSHGSRYGSLGYSINGGSTPRGGTPQGTPRTTYGSAGSAQQGYGAVHIGGYSSQTRGAAIIHVSSHHQNFYDGT